MLVGFVDGGVRYLLAPPYFARFGKEIGTRLRALRIDVRSEIPRTIDRGR